MNLCQVIGIFSTPADVDVALSNLAELDIKPSAITITLKNKTSAATLAGNNRYRFGAWDESLKDQLARSGIGLATMEVYDKKMLSGAVLLSVQVPENQVANIEETLADHQAQNITTLESA